MKVTPGILRADTKLGFIKNDVQFCYRNCLTVSTNMSRYSLQPLRLAPLSLILVSVRGRFLAAIFCLATTCISGYLGCFTERLRASVYKISTQPQSVYACAGDFGPVRLQFPGMKWSYRDKEPNAGLLSYRTFWLKQVR